MIKAIGPVFRKLFATNLTAKSISNIFVFCITLRVSRLTSNWTFFVYFFSPAFLSSDKALILRSVRHTKLVIVLVEIRILFIGFVLICIILNY